MPGTNNVLADCLSLFVNVCSFSGFPLSISRSAADWSAMHRAPLGPGGDWLMEMLSPSVTPATWRQHGMAWAE